VSNSLWAIKAARIYAPRAEWKPGIILVENQTIKAVGTPDQVEIPAGVEVIDVGEHIIAPGFIDIHIHGAMGHRVDDGTEATLAIARYLPAQGTTAWLPTLLQPADIPAVVEAMSRQEDGAEVLGLNMEGPYLAPKQLPHEGDISTPVPSEAALLEYFSAAKGAIRLMSMAPELENAYAVIAAMRDLGIVPSVAHTKSGYAEFMRAVAAGAQHVTHAYNVMTGMHHRQPGTVGGVLTCDQVTAELIADGHHVHPVAMSVLIRCKGPQSVALITDSSRYQGLPDGDYGTHVKIGGIVRHKGYETAVDHTLAGSVWPMNHNVANVAELPHVTLVEAIEMATLTPARICGVAGRKGSIEPGKDADLVVIDEKINVQMTVVRGEIAYRAGSAGQQGG
jgi:N-acetylglucosamine-6-phosphate deacetylase